MRSHHELLLATLFVVACAPSDATDARDGSATNDGGPTRDAAPADAGREALCAEEYAQLIAFFAANAQCTRDDECAIVGSCSNGHGFSAVNASVRDEAQRRSDAVTCKWADGPHYTARCELGSCVARPNGGGCGARESWCPRTHLLYRVDCSVSSDQGGTCLEPCAGADDTRCAPGFSCQASDIVPVGKDCTEPRLSTWLCRPVPSCEVLLSIDTEDRPGGSHAARRRWIFRSGESAPVRLWAENLTLAPKTIRFRDPCPAGPRLLGLGGYDAWRTCTAGACPDDLPLREVVIAPGARVSLGSATVSGAADDCNLSGLVPSRYDLSFTLEQVEGATVCGPEPLELSVQ